MHRIISSKFQIGPFALAAAVLLGTLALGPAPASALKIPGLPSSDFNSLEGAEKTDAHFEAGGWLIHSIPIVGDLLYGCPSLNTEDPGCTLVVLPIRTPGTSIEKWYLNPDTGAAWMKVAAPPLGDYVFACFNPGRDPYCDHVRLKARPPAAGLERFDAGDAGGGGLLPIALPGLGGGGDADASAADTEDEGPPHPEAFWLKASLMVPGPVNLYACRGLNSDPRCELAINALTFIQRADFGMSKLETVQDSKKKKGVAVGKVAEGSAAAKAGISEGDVIVKAAGFKLYSALHLKGLLAQIAAGKSIKLALDSGDDVTMKRKRKRKGGKK